MTGEVPEDVNDLSLDPLEIEREITRTDADTREILSWIEAAKPKQRRDVEREMGDLILNHLLPTLHLLSRPSAEAEHAAMSALIDHVRKELRRFSIAFQYVS